MLNAVMSAVRFICLFLLSWWFPKSYSLCPNFVPVIFSLTRDFISASDFKVMVGNTKTEVLGFSPFSVFSFVSGVLNAEEKIEGKVSASLSDRVRYL